jgi:hypothetical protein
MITDGASHLDSQKILGALGDSIRINTIKIGNAAVSADDKLLNDLASQGSGKAERDLAQLEEQIRQVQRTLGSTTRESEKHSMRANLDALQRQGAQLRARIVSQLRATYGREIETLSRIFVQVDDISADAVFTLQQSEIEEIRQIMEEVEMDFAEGVDADSLREAALLFEHVQMLLKSTNDSEQRRQLEEIAARLNTLLQDLVERAPAGGSIAPGLSRHDVHDLNMMLGKGEGAGESMLAVLIALLRKAFRGLFGGKH